MEIDYGRVFREGWKLLALTGIFGIVLGIGSGLLVEPFYIVRYAVQIGQIKEKPILNIDDAAMQIQGFAHQAGESLKLQRPDGGSEWRLRVEKEPPRLVRFGIWAASSDLAEGLAKRLAGLIAEDHQKRVEDERRKLEDQTREIQRMQRALASRTQEILKEVQVVQKRIGNITSRQGPLSSEEASLVISLWNLELSLRNKELSLSQEVKGLPTSRFDATQIYPLDPNPIVDRGVGVKGRAILGGIAGIFLGTFFLIMRAMRHSGKVAP